EKRRRSVQMQDSYSMIYCVNIYIFFFQAEDGIRDYKVTGVQTCALPIYRRSIAAGPVEIDLRFFAARVGDVARLPLRVGVRRSRSEERRVGKECRCRWSPSQ